MVHEDNEHRALSLPYLYISSVKHRAIALGELKGKAEGELSLVLRLLNRRVGNLPPDTLAQVQALSVESIEALGEALLDFNAIADLINWLDNTL